MSDFDLVIRGGTVVTAADTVKADVGIQSGRNLFGRCKDRRWSKGD